jgi:hypothetical protein
MSISGYGISAGAYFSHIKENIFLKASKSQAPYYVVWADMLFLEKVNYSDNN